MDGWWVEVSDGAWARRHRELDLTTGLVLGTECALVIDTRGDERQGRELLTAVRAVTELPLVVAISHAHFDHCFGTVAFTGAPVFAQAGCAGAIRETAHAQRAEWVAHYREAGDHGTADALDATVPTPPDHPVCPHPGNRHEIDLGGRVVVLTHPGPGHTGHDLAVLVPDADVLFAGDLLENGAPPSHGPDAHPDRWADAVENLLELRADFFVPGHGDPMPRSAAAVQQAELREVATLWSAVAAGDITPAAADAAAPHPGVPWPTRRT